VEKLARHLLHDPEDARDATQESLAKVCVRLRQFRGEAAFATWLHRLVVNTCRDAAARRKSWEPLPDDLRAAPTADPGDADVLRACLRELPPAQARVVVLRDAFGYSFAEIAKATAMPVGTAKCYAHRARLALRRRLENVA
jgi:RNA polymerase sigma-70 factor (ECF subfamily)